MGADKAALQLAGAESLLERTVRLVARLAAVRPPVLVVGRERPDDWAVPETVFVTDGTPGLGPMGGLRRALCACDGAERAVADAPSVLALACDMPLLTEQAIRWLADAWTGALSALPNVPGDGGPAGLAVRGREGRLEPLFSVYRAAACLPEIDARLAAGRRSLTRWIEESGRFIVRTAPDEIAVALMNVNTPEEWHAAMCAAASARAVLRIR
jgi:molybdopterin-guanine dinucleotide biosynthesis protein A